MSVLLHHVNPNKTPKEKVTWELQKHSACCPKKNPGSSIISNSSCTATYFPSHKPFKLDGQDMLSMVGEIRTNSFT